ncbi:MAG: DinB family protein [Anaerolineae bacterium]
MMSDSDQTLTRESLLSQIETSWNDLQSYLDSLSEEQLVRPTDAAGWTAKDHMIHVAVWENANLARLEGKSKRETLDITPEVWDQDDDPINAVLQERYRDMPLSEVKQALRQNHARFMAKLDTMTEADMQLPHRHYQPSSNNDTPIIQFIYWDTVHHYGEHRLWISRIVA